MSKKYDILIFGASYGSLLGAKFALAGHDVKLLCRRTDEINANGCVVRIPVRGRDGLVEIRTKDHAPGVVTAAGPGEIDVDDYDLVCLAMQEPQYKSPGVRDLLRKTAEAGKPCMSIMNMPPLPFLKRLPGIDADALRPCFTDATVWDAFDSANVTLASPDAQAFRPPGEPLNTLRVSLPTNFKVAAFEREEDMRILRDLEAGVDAVRFDVDGDMVELPVKLRVHDGIHVPLAKWPMLLTGNYRCVTPGGARAIKEAVHADIAASAAMYEWVGEVCRKLGAGADDLVPFDKYAKASEGLAKPSSAARALCAGALDIERVDLLVKTIGDAFGMSNPALDEIVELVNARLESNRTQMAE